MLADLAFRGIETVLVDQSFVIPDTVAGTGAPSMLKRLCYLFLGAICLPMTAMGIDYPYQTNESQKSGWPLTPEERAFIVEKPEFERRPGKEAKNTFHTSGPWSPVLGILAVIPG